MKDRPILFSSEMVRAILENRKTQTRRVIKPQPELTPFGDGTWLWKGEPDRFPKISECPYGNPGDRLWVRETWATSPFRNTTKPSELKRGDPEARIVYKADPFVNESHYWWRPSIHMPRWASRITLEIINVRVERVQDISEHDCIAEGMERVRSFNLFGATGQERIDLIQSEYKNIWNKINANRGFGWSVNPVVWVLEFGRV